MSSDIGRARDLTAKWYYKELWDWDLEKICTGPTREIFLKSLLICANGDGQLTENERKWVIGRAATGGAPESLLDELMEYKADEDVNSVIAGTLATNNSRRAVIYFAVKAASADGDYHGDERDAVRNVAASMGIESAAVEQIEQLCADEERLKAKRIAICFPDGNPFDAI